MLTRRALLSLPFVAPLAKALGVKADGIPLQEIASVGKAQLHPLEFYHSYTYVTKSGKIVPTNPADCITEIRNGVLYEVMPDGSLWRDSHPNSMTFEYDVNTGKRCMVSPSGEYLGEWF